MKKYKLNLTILGINLTQDNDFSANLRAKQFMDFSCRERYRAGDN